MPMPTGRMEKRIAKTVILEICLYDEPGLKERTITENVSPRGARVLVEREWRPRQQVLVISPNEGVRSRGQIVYCDRGAEGRFAVGLQLSVGKERGERPRLLLSSALFNNLQVGVMASIYPNHPLGGSASCAIRTKSPD